MIAEARCIASQQHGMQLIDRRLATRLRECIAVPGWSQRELTRHLGIGDRAASKMSSGKRDIAPELKTWLKAA